MKSPRYDYPAQFEGIFEEVLGTIGDVLRSGEYILSDNVARFEQDLASYLGIKYVVGVNSGTDALIMSLHALGIGPGDEVIAPANTFHATVLAICRVGATPVLVDADSDTFQIDVSQVQKSLSRRTKAIIPVHLYGCTAPMRELLSVANQEDLFVIEDAAQAIGAYAGDRRAGTMGNVGCFSFHPSKNLAAAGDGGAIVTDDPKIADKARVLRGLGQSSQNHHIVRGFNSKLDAIQAVVLGAKLVRLDAWNDERRKLADQYRSRLSDLPLGFQITQYETKPVFHLFVVRTNMRDQLLEHLRSKSIDAVIRYPTPIHRQPAFNDMVWYGSMDFPCADGLAEELLCLPLRPGMAVDEVDFVAETVRQFFQK